MYSKVIQLYIFSDFFLHYSVLHDIEYNFLWASLVAQMVKNLPAMQGDPGSIPASRRSPGEGNGNHSSILPGESHGQRSLPGCSLRGHKESDTTERLNTHMQGQIRGGSS